MNNVIFKSIEQEFTIYEVLVDDHEKQRSLLNVLIKEPGNNSERDIVFEILKIELNAHLAAKERCFYLPLLANDITQKKVRQCFAAHHEIDQIISTIDATDLTSTDWLALVKKLHLKVHYQLDHEESEIFQLSNLVFSEDMIISLAVKYQQEIEELRVKNW